MMEIKPSPLVTTMIVLSQLVLLTLSSMISVNGGAFDFGAAPYGDEKGVRLRLTYDYSIGQYEITNQEYIDFLNYANIPSDGSLDDVELIDMDDEDCEIGFEDGAFFLKKGSLKAPVIEITWFGAVAFCNWLSLREELPTAYDSKGNLIDENGEMTTDIIKVKGYRLPTEVEWEFAARGGKKSSGFMYAGSNKVEKVTWYGYNADWTNDVGILGPNELKLYDMSGNVSEWCQDWFIGDFFEDYPVKNPVNLKKSYYRVIRGGNWFQNQHYCRIAHRDGNSPDDSRYTVGFRVAKTEAK